MMLDKDALTTTAHEVLAKCGTTMQPDPHDRAYRIHVPSGDMKYPSFWVRDSAMMAESRLIDPDELFDWIEIVSRYGQNGPTTRSLKHRLVVLPWCVADHINFDGGAVFFPGTYDSGEDQGNGTYGYSPPHCDQYYFMHMMYLYYREAGRSKALMRLSKEIEGVTPLRRAWRAFNAHQVNPESGLCTGALPSYVVDWGFCDSIRKSGLLLYPSILRYEAAMRFSRMCGDFGDDHKAQEYEQHARLLRESIGSTFAQSDGWLVSATETCRQPDVWGTAYAVWTGALKPEVEKRAVSALAQAFRDRTISADGYIRHIPINRDFSSTSAWELTAPGMRINEYQNGGYWATPTGWVAYALSLHDPHAAETLLSMLIEHTRLHREDGAPYEWKTANDSHHSGDLYGTSGAIPLAAVARL